LQAARVDVPRDETQAQVQHGGGTIAPLEPAAQRRQQLIQHVCQGLHPLDGPLRLEHRVKHLIVRRRDERRGVFPARQALPPHAVLSQPRGQFVRRQRRKLAERANTPAGEDRQVRGMGHGAWGMG
jgi:hypothetical protein